MGRIVHPDFLGGYKPVSSSATTAPGEGHTDAGKQAYAEARPLDVAAIPRLLDDYARATRNALPAGFDGDQLHAANGYPLDPSLSAVPNSLTAQHGCYLPHGTTYT